MKRLKDLKLSTKFMASIGLILVVLTVVDVWFSMKKEKDIMYRDIENWTFIFAENVRTTLNTLMKEGQMDIRFSMLESMTEEIKGVQNVRIIRGPLVNEIFMKVKEEEVIPREQEAVESYRQEIADYRGELATVEDEAERADIKDEIAYLEEYIRDAQANIRDARQPMEVDPREAPTDELDKLVLTKGEPIYRFEGGQGRVLVPYIAQKNCTTASGCHKYAEEGEVLGAISMEFSMAEVLAAISSNNVKTAGLGLVRLGIILGLLALCLTFIVTRNIDSMLAAFKRLTGGDFTVRLRQDSEDEMGQLAKGFNFFMDKFNEVIREIQQASGHITDTANGLSASSEKIVQGAETQKSRTTQVAAASEEVSATINEIAQNSMNAAEAAKEANAATQKGGQVVSKAVEGMNGIVPLVKDSAAIVSKLGDRSKEIGKIIEVIDDIADQTNLLALNAAIEAARAGEQGRGFAVVADEVRKLAERTTQATKEIGGMIKAIRDDTDTAISSMDAEVHAVEEGVALAGEAGESLTSILENIDMVASMIQQIATAAEQQSTATSQISGDIEAVAEITKKTVDDATSIADATGDLARLSAKLQNMTTRFKIDEDQHLPSPDTTEGEEEEAQERALRAVNFD